MILLEKMSESLSFLTKLIVKKMFRLEQILKSTGGHTVCLVGYSDETQMYGQLQIFVREKLC